MRRKIKEKVEFERTREREKRKGTGGVDTRLLLL